MKTKVRVHKHLTERFENRINRMPVDAMSSKVKEEIADNLSKVILSELDSSKSYGFKLCDLDVNEKSDLCISIKGRKYIRINDFMGRDSTGNQIWAIVRDNQIKTIMLRKAIQPLAKLNVTDIINM